MDGLQPRSAPCGTYTYKRKGRDSGETRRRSPTAGVIARSPFTPKRLNLVDPVQPILNGTFSERDLTEAEAEKAQRVAHGRPRFDA